MSAASDRAFAYIAGAAVEGKLSLDRFDKGNWTGGRVGVGELRGSKYGVSAAAYPNEDIPKVTLERAKTLFERDRWKPIRGDELPYPIALCVADDAYNCGTETAVMTLQRALGVTVDGHFGDHTLAAVKGANLRQLVKDFQGLRAFAYAHDANFYRYGKDWLRERVVGTTIEAFS